MKLFGRMSICGQISLYNLTERPKCKLITLQIDCHDERAMYEQYYSSRPIISLELRHFKLN